MKKVTISDLALYKILDENAAEIYYGCDQQWYANRWQRMAGCGPTTAANLLLYLRRKEPTERASDSFLTKELCVQLMEDLWHYVTPGLGGVSSTRKFYAGVLRYAAAQQRTFHQEHLNIGKNPQARKTLAEVIAFLAEALNGDLPVAFLNLHSGAEKGLDPWHWVTIVAMEYPDDRSACHLRILDGGRQMEIDLALWLATTKNGGGFVTVRPVAEAD